MARSIFISYSLQDEALRLELDHHLAPLCRSERISTWDARQLTAGDERKGKIYDNLMAADIILLLVSAGDQRPVRGLPA